MQESDRPVGRLELIVGCMYSGKSSELMKRVRKHKLLDQKVLVINHVKDIRFTSSDNDSHIISHDRLSMKALMLNNIKDGMAQIQDHDVICVDEGQFFHDLYEIAVHIVDELGKILIISALDGTYERKPFENVARLIPFADDVTHLHALCLICKDGTLASFSKRIINIGKTDEFVGGTESYVSVCRKHFK